MKNARRQMLGYRNSRTFNPKANTNNCNRNNSQSDLYNCSNNAYFHHQNSENPSYGNNYYDDRGLNSQPNNAPQCSAPPFSVSNAPKILRGYSRDVSAHSDNSKRYNTYDRPEVIEPHPPPRPPLPQTSSSRETGSGVMAGPLASENYRTISHAVVNHIPPPPPPTTSSYVASSLPQNSSANPATENLSLYFPIKTELTASTEMEQPSKYFARDPLSVTGTSLHMPSNSFLNYNSMPSNSFSIPYVNLEPVSSLGYNTFHSLTGYTYLEPYLSSTLGYQQQLQQHQLASSSYQEYCNLLYETIMNAFPRSPNQIVPTQTPFGLLPPPWMVSNMSLSSILPSSNVQFCPPITPAANAAAAMSYRPSRSKLSLVTELANPILQYGCNSATGSSFLNLKTEIVPSQLVRGEGMSAEVTVPSTRVVEEAPENRNIVIDSPGLLLNRDFISDQISGTFVKPVSPEADDENRDVKWGKDFASEFLTDEKPKGSDEKSDRKETFVKREAEEVEFNSNSTEVLDGNEQVVSDSCTANQEKAAQSHAVKLEPTERNGDNFPKVPEI